jgi:hypothetical protein
MHAYPEGTGRRPSEKEASEIFKPASPDPCEDPHADPEIPQWNSAAQVLKHESKNWKTARKRCFFFLPNSKVVNSKKMANAKKVYFKYAFVHYF